MSSARSTPPSLPLPEGLSPSDRERLDDLRARFTRGEVFAEDCPSREILRHVTSRWGGLTLMALYGGTMRFSELRSKIKGVSERMLSQTLDTLEADGLVSRRSYPVVPPHVEYSLTPMGVELTPRIIALAEWIELNIWRVMEVRRRSVLQPEGDAVASM